MKKFFQYINKKPKSVRDNYALAIASLFTSIVMIFWVVAQTGSETLASKTEDSSTPFATLIKETKEKLFEMKANDVEVAVEGNQVASVINSSSTSVDELVLDQEDIEKAKQDLERAQNSNSIDNTNTNFTEVMIGTTSVSGVVENTTCVGENCNVPFGTSTTQ